MSDRHIVLAIERAERVLDGIDPAAPDIPL
jgi:hypothetical protein